MQPDKQHGIHRTFENEVEHLDTLFKSKLSFVSFIACVSYRMCLLLYVPLLSFVSVII